MTEPAPRRRFFQFPGRSRKQIDSDIDAELRFHFDHMESELVAAGWGATEARLEAIRRFGDVPFTKQYCRGEDRRREMEKRRMTFFDELGQDLRYAARSLRSAPGFTLVALLTLALGIGANTAIFSVVRGVLLERLPFPAAEQLVRVWHSHPANGIEQSTVSEPDFLEWREQSQRAQSMGGYWYTEGQSGMDFTGGGDPERLSATLVTDGFFQTLGTAPLLGRFLRPEEHVPGRDRVVVLSHGMWMRRFGEDPTVIGRSIQLEGEPFEVIGIMPPGFTYPAERTVDVWLPVSFFGPEDIGRSRYSRFISVVARLKPGATESQLNAELVAIAERQAETYPENAGWTSVRTQSIRESIVGEVKRPLVVLMAAVGMLLLIACVNIANLLLARASGRQRELAVRAALGAGRGRITRQLLTESFTLALLGGALGILLGLVAIRAFAATGASEMPRANEIRIDGIVLGFTLVVSMLAGLLFGLMPALRASGINLERSLRAGSRGSVGGAGQRLRSALVVVEVALAVILVVGAGLATKSFARLLSVSPGFEPARALVVTFSISDSYVGESSEARWNYYTGVLDAVRAIPGVVAAGSVKDLPMRAGGELVRYEVPGEGTPMERRPTAHIHQISSDYFKAMGTPLLEGRAFELTDKSGAPFVVMVNEELARRAWPGERVAGKALRFGTSDVPIIGVVANMRQRGLAEPYEPAIYLHALQNFRSRMNVVLRTSGNPLTYADRVKQAVWSINPNQTITSVTTLDNVVGSAVARPRLLAWLLALFGIIALTLGALGIFGVLAYAVNQRRQEIGVRVALGASPRSVLRLIVGQGMLLAFAGVVAGVAGAALLTRSMQAVLFGIQPSDPLTFIQVTVVLLGAALLASWLPARRALAIDPVTALRYD